MIEIDFYVLPEGELIGFYMAGHAGFAAKGADIVCAAVSSAAYMAANTLTEVMGISPMRLYTENGIMDLKTREQDARLCRAIFRGLKLHLIHLEAQYPSYIRVGYHAIEDESKIDE